MELSLKGKDFDALSYLLKIKRHGSVNAFISSLSPKSEQKKVYPDLTRSLAQLEHFLCTSLRLNSKPQRLNNKGDLIAEELARLENLLCFFKRDSQCEVIFFGSKSYTDIFVSTIAASLFNNHKIISVIKNGNSNDTLKALFESSADIYLIKKSAFKKLSSFARKKLVYRPLREFNYQWAIPNGKKVFDVTSGSLPVVGLSLQSDTMSFITKRFKDIKWSSFFSYFKDVAEFAQANKFAAVIPSYFFDTFQNYKFFQIEGSEKERIYIISYQHIYKSSQNVKHSFDRVFSAA